jgi:hypothetical protein
LKSTSIPYIATQNSTATVLVVLLDALYMSGPTAEA